MTPESPAKPECVCGLRSEIELSPVCERPYRSTHFNCENMLPDGSRCCHLRGCHLPAESPNLDPVMHEPSRIPMCTCRDIDAPGIVHRIDGPCYIEPHGYPSHEQHLAWYAEFQKLQGARMFSLQDYCEYVVPKAVDWAIRSKFSPAAPTVSEAEQ